MHQYSQSGDEIYKTNLYFFATVRNNRVNMLVSFIEFSIFRLQLLLRYPLYFLS